METLGRNETDLLLLLSGTEGANIWGAPKSQRGSLNQIVLGATMRLWGLRVVAGGTAGAVMG